MIFEVAVYVFLGRRFVDLLMVLNMSAKILKIIIRKILVYNLRPKIVVLFPEIGRVKKFYHSLAHIVECVSEYIFLIPKEEEKKKKTTATTTTTNQK